MVILNSVKLTVKINYHTTPKIIQFLIFSMRMFYVCLQKISGGEMPLNFSSLVTTDLEL